MKAEQEYWLERGQNEAATYRASDAHLAQETALLRLLAPLKFATMLDVGCGFGRIGALVADRQEVDYTGIDISEQMVNAARRRIPKGRFAVTSLEDFSSEDEPYDLVLASEFLMHVPPEEVQDAVKALVALSRRHVVTVDWTEPIRKPAAAHNWRHDYQALFTDAGAEIRRSQVVGKQTIYRVKGTGA